MSLTLCPAAVVAAPIESVWELLSDPTLYDDNVQDSLQRLKRRAEARYRSRNIEKF